MKVYMKLRPELALRERKKPASTPLLLNVHKVPLFTCSRRLLADISLSPEPVCYTARLFAG